MQKSTNCLDLRDDSGNMEKSITPIRQQSGYTRVTIADRGWARPINYNIQKEKRRNVSLYTCDAPPQSTETISSYEDSTSRLQSNREWVSVHPYINNTALLFTST